MLIKLKSQTHVETLKVSSISPLQGDKHVLKTNNGLLVDVTPTELPWLRFICGFMVENTQTKDLVNLKSVVTTVPNQDGALVTMENGDTFQISADQNWKLAGLCNCLDLEERILFLQSQDITPENYQKL